LSCLSYLPLVGPSGGEEEAAGDEDAADGRALENWGLRVKVKTTRRKGKSVLIFISDSNELDSD